MLTEYYRAAHQSAALTEKNGFGLVKLTGSERVSWLQGMVTNDVQKLAPGSGCFAAHLTAQGKIVAQMQVLAGEETLWLALERASIPKLLEAFGKLLIMEDAGLTDCSGDYDILSMLGPRAATVLESWLGEPLHLDSLYRHREFADCRVVVSDLGYDIWVEHHQADNVLRALAQSGATAIDRGTWDVLRTEAGIPIYGIDIDESTTLPEIGEKAISYDKGCYVGQEVVAKIKYIGHVNRRFTGLVVEGNDLPELKSTIRKADKDVGYVTTSLFSPGLGRPIALGFMNRVAYAPGTRVEIAGQGKPLAASVSELPFVPNPLPPGPGGP